MSTLDDLLEAQAVGITLNPEAQRDLDDMRASGMIPSGVARTAAPTAASAPPTQRRDPISGTAGPSIPGDLLHFAMQPGKEFWGGLKDAFLPEYGPPNAFDRGVGGALGIDPMTLQKYVSTPVSQVLGLLRSATSPAALVTEPAKVVGTRGAQAAGLPEDVSHMLGATAELGAGLVAPQGLVNAIPKAAARGANVLSLLGARALPSLPFGLTQYGGVPKAASGVIAAEKASGQALSSSLDDMATRTAMAQESEDAARAVVHSNRYTNEAQRQQYAKQVADRDAALSNVANLESRVAQYGQTLGDVESPLAKSLYATQGATDKERATAAYAKFEKIKSDVAIALHETLRATDGVLARYGDSVAPSLKPKSITRAATGLQDAMSDRNLFVEIAGKLKRMGNSLVLADVQTNMQGLGKLTRSADKQIANDARRLYWSMMADADAAGDAGKTFLAANRAHAQNMAADTVADKIASAAVTTVNKRGDLIVKPEGLASWLKQESRQVEQIRKSFPPGELQRIMSTLDDVFKARQAVPGKPTRPTLEKEIFVPREPAASDAVRFKYEPIEAVKPKSHFDQGHGRFAVAGLAGPALMALGFPTAGSALSAAYLATYAPTAYSKMIFNTAVTERGRTMLRALYKDSTPSLRDVEKITTLRQFLDSQNIGAGGIGDMLRAGGAAGRIGE